MQSKFPVNLPQSPGIPKKTPRISIIIPFESKMNSKKGLDLMLSIETGKAEKELMKEYPDGDAIPVLEKLHRLVLNLDYKSHKSIAIFVSPLAEKIYYFNYSDKKLENRSIFEI